MSMLISSKSEYGLRALMDIAMHGKGQPVGRLSISERQRIPLPYLTQVLRSLVNAGLLKSTRGPAGGYLLTKDPEEISLLEVVTTLQGPVMPTSCDAESGRECTIFHDCGLMGVWSRLKSTSEDVLGSTSLKSVISGDGGAVDMLPPINGIASPTAQEKTIAEAQQPAVKEVAAHYKLDCIGFHCPLPIVKIAEKMRELEPGHILEVWADDEGAKADIPAWCMGTGNEFLEREEFGKQMKFLIRKAT